MITICALLIFIASYLLYSTSKNAINRNNSVINNWIRNNNKVAKIIGLCLLLISLIWSVNIFSITGGILSWLFLLILFIGFSIVFTPLKFTYKLSAIVFFIALITELVF